MKQLVKTMDEYASDLLKIAPTEVVQEFFKYMADGNKIQAVKILKNYKLIDE